MIVPEEVIRGCDFEFTQTVSGEDGEVDVFGSPEGFEIRIPVGEDGTYGEPRFCRSNDPDGDLVVTLERADGDVALSPEEVVDHVQTLAFELIDDNPQVLARLEVSPEEDWVSFG